MTTEQKLNWLNVYIDIWSRAYVSSDDNEDHQKNMQNALYDFCDKEGLPYMSADEIITELLTKQ
jgi:hypothetical protein